LFILSKPVLSRVEGVEVVKGVEWLGLPALGRVEESLSNGVWSKEYARPVAEVK
jgi:hypothetical protein